MSFQGRLNRLERELGQILPTPPSENDVEFWAHLFSTCSNDGGQRSRMFLTHQLEGDPSAPDWSTNSGLHRRLAYEERNRELLLADPERPGRDYMLARSNENIIELEGQIVQVEQRLAALGGRLEPATLPEDREHAREFLDWCGRHDRPACIAMVFAWAHDGGNGSVAVADLD